MVCTWHCVKKIFTIYSFFLKFIYYYFLFAMWKAFQWPSSLFDQIRSNIKKISKYLICILGVYSVTFIKYFWVRKNIYISSFCLYIPLLFLFLLFSFLSIHFISFFFGTDVIYASSWHNCFSDTNLVKTLC